ncbi:hypothetical protein D018_3115B, partial [Vibrio parahaemolyticus VP2007-007]
NGEPSGLTNCGKNAK